MYNTLKNTVSCNMKTIIGNNTTKQFLRKIWISFGNFEVIPHPEKIDNPTCLLSQTSATC